MNVKSAFAKMLTNLYVKLVKTSTYVQNVNTIFRRNLIDVHFATKPYKIIHKYIKYTRNDPFFIIFIIYSNIC